MAYQAGTLRLKGKLGDLSFYYNRECGYLVRQKGGPDKKQIAGSPNFERTRENNAEFSLAAAAGKLIRQAVRAATGLKGDSYVSQRLNGLLVSIGKTDLSSARGSRSPVTVFNEPDSRALLRSFAFYTNRPLTSVYTGQIQCNPATGSIVFTTGTSESIADLTVATDLMLAPAIGLVPASELFRAPKGATHVRIKAVLVVLNFEQNSYVMSQAPIYTALLEDSMPEYEFSTSAGSGDPAHPFENPFAARIGIVAIEFLQEKNGGLYVLADGVSLGIV